VKLRGWTTLVGAGLGLFLGLMNGWGYELVPAGHAPIVVAQPFFAALGGALALGAFTALFGAAIGAVVGWCLGPFIHQN
jgi:hypothetical protein